MALLANQRNSLEMLLDPFWAPDQLVKRTILVSCIILLSGGRFSASLHADSPASTDKMLVRKILDVWKRRENATASLSASWKIDRTAENHWSTYQADYWSQSRNEPVEEIDTQSIFIKGNRLRYEAPRWHQRAHLDFSGYSEKTSDGPSGKDNFHIFHRTLRGHFDGSIPQLKPPHHFISVFNQQTRTDYFQNRGVGKSLALISRQKQYEAGEHAWVESAIFRPLQLFYRPIQWNQSFLFEEEKYAVLNTNSKIDGRKCIVLEYPATINLRSRCWVDPEQDFLVLRNLLLRGDNIMEQVDIEYKQQEAKTGWIPDRWTVILKSHYEDFPGRPLVFQFASCQLTQLSLNPALEDNLFQLGFQPGTYVFDAIKKDKTVILPDNTTRQLPFHELPQLDFTGNLIQSPKSAGRPSRYIAGIVMIFMAVTFFYIRRRWRADR